MSSIKTFFIQFSQYFSGMVLVQLFGLITFPILTRAMSIEEYGIFSLINTTMMIVVVPSKAGLSNSTIRFYAEYDSSENERNLFASTTMYYGVAFAAAGAIIYMTGFWAVQHYAHFQREYVICFLIMGAYQFIRPISIIGVNFLRVNNRTVFINTLSLIGKIIATGLGLLLFLVVVKRLYGLFLGSIVAEYICSFFVFYWFFKKYKFNIHCVSRTLIKSMMIFGFPLLLNEMGYLILSYADRYIISWLLGNEALGIYSVGYNLAMYVCNVVIFALSYSVVPLFVEIYAKEGRRKTEQFLDKTMHYLIIALLPICFGYIAVSHELFIVLASDKYSAAGSFSGIILVGNMLLGINNILNAGLYLKKKSVSILCIMIAAVVINIVLNFILIPILGVYGAALATLIACIFSTAITIIFSFPHLKVKVGVKPFSYYLILSTLMFFTVIHMNPNDMILGLIIKVIFGALIIGSGILIKERELRVKILARLKT